MELASYIISSLLIAVGIIFLLRYLLPWAIYYSAKAAAIGWNRGSLMFDHHKEKEHGDSEKNQGA